MWAGKYYRWNKGEKRDITIARYEGNPDNVRFDGQKRTFALLAPYDSVICQLLREHGLADTLSAQRRRAYAGEVLDAFAHEIWEFNGDPAAFRSRVLTPILARVFAGVHDGSLPIIRSALSGDPQKEPDMQRVVKFYLGRDLTDPAWVPTIMRNMIYVPRARWYLGVVLGRPDEVGCPEYRRRVMEDHDDIVDYINHRGLPQVDEKYGLPPLTIAEALSISHEGLSAWFLEVLKITVRNSLFIDIYHLPTLVHSRRGT